MSQKINKMQEENLYKFRGLINMQKGYYTNENNGRDTGVNSSMQNALFSIENICQKFIFTWN